MGELRLGDIIDDYCIKCRRLTNHAIVSLMGTEVAKVRCRSCYHDHTYLKEQIPPSKKDLKKAELFNAVLGTIDGTARDGATPDEPSPDGAIPVEALPELASVDGDSPELPLEAQETQPQAEETAKKTRARVRKA